VFTERRIARKTPAQVQQMRAAGLVVARTLAEVSQAAAPGVTTQDLDALAEDVIRSEGGVPSFKGYHGFPASLCTSVNEEVVHGIPGRRPLRDGDVLSVDCGAVVDGWHGDAAVTVPIGAVTAEVTDLIRTAEQALWRGLAAARPGGRLSDISAAIEAWVNRRGTYGIVEDYVGHGIGEQMHQPPNVPNQGRPGRGPRLHSGVVLAVEPMLTLGSPRTDILDDDWTVVTTDRRVAVHVEHTVAVTDDGPWVLTALDGGTAGLASIAASAP